MNAVILIGGEGTRLRPLTLTTPKPLLPILNRPTLAYQLDLLKHHGIRDIILCVGYLSSVFEQRLGDGRRWGVRLRYVYESSPLGTGGAIKNAEPYVDDSVFILNGDIITTIDLTAMLAFHRRKRAAVTIALYGVENPGAYGLVQTTQDGRIRRFVEKPRQDGRGSGDSTPSSSQAVRQTINAGVYVFDPEVFSYLPSQTNYSVERGLFPRLLKLEKPVYGFLHRGLWLDIGTLDSYLHAHATMLKRKMDGGLPPHQLQPGVWVERGVKVGPSCTFKGRMVVGAGSRFEEAVQLRGPLSLGRQCRVGKGASLDGSVILDRAVIGQGARLQGCVVGQGCHLESHVTLSPGTVLGDDSHVKAYSRLGCGAAGPLQKTL